MISNKKIENKISQNCKKCGCKHELYKCPAYNHKCRKCQKLNHFEAYCLEKRVSFFKKSSYKNENRGKFNKNFERKNNVNGIENVDFIDMVLNKNPSVKPILKKLFLNDKKIIFEVDTGAGSSLIDVKQFQNIVGEFKLKHYNGRLKSVTGDNTLRDIIV